MSFPSLEDLGDKIQTTEDLISFRTRFPELYARVADEEPIDNSHHLLADMDRYGVTHAIVQPRPGNISNEQVASIVRKNPKRLFGLFSFGNEEQIEGYLDDPTPVREHVVREIEHCITGLGLKGMGETPIRLLTNEIHPERIARDLDPVLKVMARHNAPWQIPTAWSQFRGGLHYRDPLWVDELAPRYPEAPIILTKMGRGFQTYFDHALTVALRNVNVYFDVVGTSPAHLRQAVDRIGAERIMFGTDWSATWRWVRKPGDVYSMRLKTLSDAGLSDADKEHILWKTADSVFRLNIHA